jgi:hypothetical protein
MDATSCAQTLRVPPYERGTVVADGAFFRNLEPDRVTKRYAEDGEPATFGYRLRPEKWMWIKDEQEGLSVNLCSCVPEPICSILLHPEPERFHHLVEINLRALVEQLGMELAAIYDPIDPPHSNPCHFNIVPLNDSIIDLRIRLKDFLARVFPLKFPRDDLSRQQAHEARRLYETVFRIIRNVAADSDGIVVR